ncbi:hypothetical protein BG003_007337 [Podila horticola]|nr:hypothetical protein BG003_007337 [Podila horticola]
MLLKAASLVVSSISYHHCNIPPASSKTVSGDSDKIQNEGWNKKSLLTWLPYVLAYSHNFGTLIYVMTILRGGSIGKFDFQLTIRKGHRLIGHGPYTNLRHPAYAGTFINKIAAVTLLFHHGLWDIVVAWMTVLTGHAIQAEIPLIMQIASWTPVSPTSTWTGLLGYPADVWFCLAFYCLVFKILEIRIAGEEKMLKEHFRKEWDVYASKRWRWIPLIY